MGDSRAFVVGWDEVVELLTDGSFGFRLGSGAEEAAPARAGL